MMHGRMKREGIVRDGGEFITMMMMRRIWWWLIFNGRLIKDRRLIGDRIIWGDGACGKIIFLMI